MDEKYILDSLDNGVSKNGEKCLFGVQRQLEAGTESLEEKRKVAKVEKEVPKGLKEEKEYYKTIDNIVWFKLTTLTLLTI